MHSLTIAHKSTIKLQHLLHIDFFYCIIFISFCFRFGVSVCFFRQNISLTFRFHFSTIVCGFLSVKIVVFFLSCFRLPDCIWYQYTRWVHCAMCMCDVWCTTTVWAVGCSVRLFCPEYDKIARKKIETRSFFVCKKMNCTLDVFEEDREIDIWLLPYFYSTFFDFFSIRSFRFRFYLQCLCVFFYSFEAKR